MICIILIIMTNKWPISDQLKIRDDKLSDIDISILITISLHLGTNAQKLLELLTKQYSNIIIDIIRNSLKRKLNSYVEFKRASKMGGYYIISERKIKN